MRRLKPLGFFKVTAGDWIDLTGDGDPRPSMPMRPYFGMAPHVAIASPGGHVFLIGREVVYRQAAQGFVPVTITGSIRTVCGC